MLDVSGPLTASKLLADYNLAVLTSFVQKKKKKKKLVERFNVKAIVCNFTPRGIKVNSKSQPQHLSLTLMSRLSWNTTSPGAKITHIPRAATGVGEADGKLRNRTGEKKGGDGGGGGGEKAEILSDARRASHFSFAVFAVADVTDLDVSADCTGNDWD